MLDPISSLQTNVIATVRRDRTELSKANSGLSDQARQQSKPFILNSTPAPQTRTTNPLDDQISELISVAQAAAQSSGGIEPKAAQNTLYGRAAAAYERMNSYGNPTSARPLLSLTA